MKRFLITFIAVVAGQLFLLLIFLLVVTSLLSAAVLGRAGRDAPVPSGSFLIQDVPTQLPEYTPMHALPFRPRPISHTDLLENLEKARVDERIAGVVLKIENPQVGFAKLGEIRTAVSAVRAAGKPVYAHAMVVTQKDLYLAAACDSIFVHPSGLVHLSGLSSERYYLRRLLDELEIETQVSQIKEYKAMAEMVLRDEMSPEARENARWILGDLYEAMLTDLAHDRGVEPEAAAGWFETCQFGAHQAAERGIIDGALVWEDLAARLNPQGRSRWSVEGADYALVPRSSLGLRGERVAVVHGTGTITLGESGWAFPFGATMGDETIIAALREAMEDETVAAVVLRLDTGGGLTTASDRIGRMVARVAARKPLVVSMADITASGGYMASYRCSTLVAHPNSIVGSIGSINMRGNVLGLLGKLGITVDRATVGPHASSLSMTASLSEEEFDRLEEIHWRSYERWVDDVARHRGLTGAEMDNVARGRVFTGRQALERGLVDQTGGFATAVAALKTLAGIPPEEEVSYVHLPRPKGLLEMLTQGEFLAMGRRLAGGGPGEAPDQTVAFWRQCLAAEESLALLWWRL